ncbi:MAG: 23S rRNA (adenine(2503)-C(2))-methyltransferase [Alphaproteobacteria bacterium GWF2_58_20]|nr:MAG: 23S rRNA (adenine(2503)-C(2))-methyltransferase [Alphaproteobacteria bacterium GWF2_58_20]
MGLASHGEWFSPPQASAGERKNLIGLDREELAAEMKTFGLEPFRARQLWHAIYHRGQRDFRAMTTIAKPVQERLAEAYVLEVPQVVEEHVSSDGSRKWLMRMVDGHEVETVFIPDEDRGAICISSQVGCTLRCTFCHTGTQDLVRNLSSAEIVGQVMAARDALGEWPGQPSENQRQMTNIVLMGMGEPLFNFDNVSKALHIIMDGEGISISKRRITLSTSGVVPMIGRCGAELGVNLAISLHATNDEVRSRIMPINRKYPIASLMAACKAYPGLSNARRITFEYLMLKGINDSTSDALALVKLLSGIPAKVNLLPFNAWPGSPYEPSDEATMHRFADLLMSAGFASPIRTPRGRDIMAACGQLRSQSLRARQEHHHEDEDHTHG